MTDGSRAAGIAALSICESILLSLIDNKIIDAAEARAVLADAAEAHRGAAPQADGAANDHVEAAELIEAIISNGNAVRRRRSASTIPDEG